MSALLAQAQRMQEQLLAAKEDLASAVVEGSAAGGLVTARVNGTGDLIGLDIKPEAVDPEDTETLADMVVAAIRDAAAHRRHERVLLAVGPEGGWNAFEVGLLEAHAFQRVSMGPRTLRSDTACVALIAVVNEAIRKAIMNRES